MSILHEYYPAKLLLFGEYTVLNGSQALAVPLNQYQGKWIKGTFTDPSVSEVLNRYVAWLQNESLINQETGHRIISEFEEGYYFESTIPQGYGIGSSGAFVAAMYDRYFKADEDINVIHTTMARMECFFHGASSGLDPLISFTRKAVYKDEEGRYHAVADPGWPEGYKIYLLDSGLGRETGPLVQQYKNKLLDPSFAEKIQRQFIPMVEHAIHFYLASENKLLEECISIISQFQREYFTEMIPDHVKKKWNELVNKTGVYVKLCGAGGGGYFMVIANENTVSQLNDKNILISVS